MKGRGDRGGPVLVMYVGMTRKDTGQKVHTYIISSNHKHIT